MKLLHIIESVDLRSGGTVEALRSLGEELVKLGFDQSVLSLDPSSAQPARDFPLPVYPLGGRKLSGSNPFSKFYNWARIPSETMQQGRAHLRAADAVVVHGLWDTSTHLARKLLAEAKVPYVVYPHGMLDPWFKRRYPVKHLAKQVIWLASVGGLLKEADAVLFTCEEERILARQSFRPYSVRERVVAFGTKRPPPPSPEQERAFRALLPRLGERPYLLFLSRIHEKKGCDLLVQAFASIAAGFPDIDLVIAGPDSSGLKRNLTAMAGKAGIADRLHWPGMITGDAKYGAYRGAEAFVLPSHQENFGIVVAEALACKCPVLISNRVNIWREIETAGAGLIAEDTLEGTIGLLNRFLSLSIADRRNMAQAGFDLFEDRFTSDAAGIQLSNVLREISKGD